MVKRMVKLAQIVCAVYSLNKPSGASRAEIAKFCALRFGIARTPQAFDRVLERAIDQGLLTRFQRRYRLARSCRHILWAQRKKRKECGRFKNSNRRKEKRLKSARLRRKRSVREKDKKNFVCKNSQVCSSFYESWCEQKQKTEMAKKSRNKKQSTFMKRNHVNQNCKVHNRVSNPARGTQPSRTTHRRPAGRREAKVKFNLNRSRQGSKRNFRPRHENPAGSSHYKNMNGILRRKESKRSSKASSSKSSNKNLENSRTSFYRQVLQRTKQAVVHAKSWDALNQSRQRHNQRVAKKILSGSHAASWDKLNDKLRRIRECKSRPVMVVDGGRPPSVRSRRSRNSHGR